MLRIVMEVIQKIKINKMRKIVKMRNKEMLK